MISAYSIVLIQLCVGQSPQSLDEIVAAHESASAAVRRFDIVVQVRQVQQNGKQVNPPTDLGVFRWSHEGTRERTQIEYAPSTVMASDSPRSKATIGLARMDVFTDGTSDYLLRNWDPKAPKKITPWNDQGVKGTMGTAAPGLYNTYYALGSIFTLTHVAACTFDQQRSLKEFVNDSPDVKLDIVKYRGNDAPKLTMQHPDTKTGGKFRDTVISVILDPASYMITEMEIQLPETALGIKSRQVLRVQKFREFADGAVLPEKVSANSYHQGGSGVNELTMVTAKTTVNRELPADALDFRFPEGTMVYDHATLRGGKVTVHVWGPDGRPARSLSDMSELGPPPSDADARQNNRGWVSYAVYGIGGPVVIGLVLFLLWRRRK